MEKTMDWEQKTLLNELTQGREVTNLLRKHLHPSSSPETRQVLVEKILCSYEKALSILNWSGFVVETKPTVSTLESPASIANSSPGSEASDKKDVFKKRKTSSSGWTEQVKVCSGTSLEGPLDDGYCWRKYGQKEILGSNFPRGYYRCTHRHSQGCLATKQVQKSDEDPAIFEVKYRGRHTCNRASHFAATSVPVTRESKEKGNHSRQKQQQQRLEEKQKRVQEMFPSFDKVKTEDLDNREDIFPTFSFSLESEEVKNGSFVEALMENDIIGNLSPAFMSPTTSESNYFSLSPYHLGSFGLGQHAQTSESDLTEIISAPTSVTNSPIGDLDISSLDKLEFDPSFPFDNPEYFS